MIEVERVTKRFGSVTALDDLTFMVRPGRVTGLLGPNGAGKTTTMRIVLGLQSPTSGHALVGGVPYRRLVRPLSHVGALLEANALHPGRTARSHLQSIAQCNGIGRRRVVELLELTGLANVADKRAREFSLGMKQRLGLAVALLGDPPILVFDEPVNGLDPEGIGWIRSLFRAFAREGRTVLVSSHLMGEMALTADHLVIIGRGRLLADASLDDFIAAHTRTDVRVSSPQSDTLARLLEDRGARVSPDGTQNLAVTGLPAAEVGEIAAAHGLTLHELRTRHATLEDAYLAITHGSGDYQTGGTPAPLERSAS